MATKPYCASGRYINRQSNYCRDCRYRPAERTGDEACPFTILYWDFLMRHRDRLEGNRRMTFQLKNLSRLDKGEKGAVRRTASELKDGLSGG
jgi:deoxyribodipyrimidine photolyase-related protein